jgi:hypothetical protein
VGSRDIEIIMACLDGSKNIRTRMMKREDVINCNKDLRPTERAGQREQPSPLNFVGIAFTDGHTPPSPFKPHFV